MDREKFKQSIIEMRKCFEEQFIESGDCSYGELLDYCDFLFENYEKIGILEGQKVTAKPSQ